METACALCSKVFLLCVLFCYFPGSISRNTKDKNQNNSFLMQPGEYIPEECEETI